MLFWFDDTDIYLKRVIGLPGETITFSDGFVYIDDQKYDEAAYLDASVTTWPDVGYDVFEIPQDGYFVMGDNREISYGSHYWDEPYVYFDAIVGKILFTIPTPLYS